MTDQTAEMVAMLIKEINFPSSILNQYILQRIGAQFSGYIAGGSISFIKRFNSLVTGFPNEVMLSVILACV
jgi:hypothetical protein